MKNNEVYSKTFLWLFIGLLITFVSGFFLSENPTLTAKLLSVGALPILAIELVIAFIFNIFIRKINPFFAKILYLVFSITTGITFSTIFITYELTSLLSIFIVTSIIFAVLALFGYKTKKDLSKMGTIALITFIITIICSLLNYLIFKSSMFEIFLSMISIFVFMGFIAYDMKIIKALTVEIDEEKVAVYGAFTLYLDFINLLVRLIQFFGERKENQ